MGPSVKLARSRRARQCGLGMSDVFGDVLGMLPSDIPKSSVLSLQSLTGNLGCWGSWGCFRRPPYTRVRVYVYPRPLQDTQKNLSLYAE